jgi:serine protease AprX
MTVSQSVSWDDAKKKRGAAVLLLSALLVLPVPRTAPADQPGAPLALVIVEALPGAANDMRQALADLGGTVERDLGIIDGVVVSLPVAAVGSLRSARGVQSVTPDVSVQLHRATDEADSASDDSGSMYRATRAIGARALWSNGITGEGVDIALIDSGVVPVDGLIAAGKIVNGADLSFESQSNDLRYLDTFGHGTHMAGIIAGRDDAIGTEEDRQNPDNFVGVAPGARIVNV